MNPPSFSGLNTTEDPKNFIEELINVFEVEEKNLRDREDFKNKRPKTGNGSRQKKSNANQSSFKQKRKGPALSSASAPAPKNKGEYYGQNSRVKFAYSQGNSCKSVKGTSKEMVMVEIELVFISCSTRQGYLEELITVLTEDQIVDPRPSLYFVAPYVAMNFDIPERLSEPFSVSTHVVEILDRQARRLRNREVASVKVLWRSQSVEGATWEAEAAMKAKYHHSFLTIPLQLEAVLQVRDSPL
ncbi:hypothetical protein EJD97_025751 [Solanum chilense]|uniref:Chromo domain-containing protein n=1 Tax=Solanum chilense TaxID=4083 RepID=A0A6N2C7H8_SOLCI|nr:hypothetical protein EJD97_025751 [Solanum chilense]